MDHQLARWNTSASNVHRRVRCPGSAAAEAGLPEEQSEYSEEGTRLHTLFGLPAAEFDGLTADTASEDDISLVGFARHLATDAVKRAIAAFDVPSDEPFEQGSERELWLHKGINPILPGHCDVWRYYPRIKLLIIIDAKFGFVVVDPAPINIQLRTYAVQAAEEWDVENAVVAIVQPRASGEGTQKLSVARYDRSDIKLAREQLLAWREEWEAPNAPRRASESACRYCKAQLLCDQFRARLLPAVQQDGVLPALAAMDEQTFASLWLAIKLASNEKVVATMKMEAEVRIAEGGMPGYKLKPNSPRSTLVNHYGACAILRHEDYLTEQDLMMSVKISSKELVEVVKARKGFPTKKAAEEAIKAKLDPVKEKMPVAPSIVQTEADDTARYLE